MIKVLDKGFVELIDHMGSDLTVVNAAKVSKNAKAETLDEKGARLINFLMTNRHTSPFEHVVFQFRIRAPIFVFREWHRHRTWSYNELSARYAPVDLGHYIPDRSRVLLQAKNNKQGGEGALDDFDQDHFIFQLKKSSKDSHEYYQENLDKNMERGLARLFMQVNAYSEMVATVDLWNLFHFLELRMDKNAQWEIRQYAKALYQLINEHVPVSTGAWINSLGLKFDCMEWP